MSVKLRLHAAPARLVVLAVGIVVTVVVLLTLSGAEAANKQPSCGDTITVDTKLESDLVDCPNNGLVIGADGVTLDLNGHRIEGDGKRFADCPKNEFCDVGVLSDRYDGVSVKNGTTRGFNFGVTMAGSDGSEIVGITATNNVSFGAIFIQASRGVVRKSTLSHNTPPEGDGLGLFRCKRMQVLHNSIEDNEGPGIHVGDSSTRVLIKKNEFTNDGPAVLIEANRTEVRGNRVVGGAGIVVNPPGKHNVIAHNRVVRATDSIAIENGRDNLVADNVVIEARGRTGIRLGIGNPSLGGAANTVTRNEVRKAHNDAFHVYEKDHGSVLRQNVAVGAGGDGFAVESPRTTLRGNRAVRNGELGFRAVRGVTAGKSNVARHNGDHRQCTHIACK